MPVRAARHLLREGGTPNSRQLGEYAAPEGAPPKGYLPQMVSVKFSRKGRGRPPIGQEALEFTSKHLEVLEAFLLDYSEAELKEKKITVTVLGGAKHEAAIEDNLGKKMIVIPKTGQIVYSTKRDVVEEVPVVKPLPVAPIAKAVVEALPNASMAAQQKVKALSMMSPLRKHPEKVQLLKDVFDAGVTFKELIDFVSKPARD